MINKVITFPATRTVYGLPTLESRRVFSEVTSNLDLFEHLYGKPYLKRQDPAHKLFLDTYLQWSKPVVAGLESFEHRYPSNGSSEAIKDTINQLHANNPQAKLGVFTGEYEGAVNYADAARMPLIKINRFDKPWADLASELKPGDYFYTSQPSALDGNLYEGYKQLVEECAKLQIKLLVDLTYVGAVAKPYQIDVSSPAIHTVFISLSKLGMYYQRIGGCYSREPNGFLFGNMWFKNMLSLAVGTRYLELYPVFEVARKYAALQHPIVADLNRQYGLTLKPCDVYLLASQFVETDESLDPLFADLIRPLGSKSSLRACLTPLLDAVSKGRS